MNARDVLHLAEQGVLTVLFVAGPILLIALGVGLIISILQAMTQIQEQTLSFIPKIIAVLLGMILFGPWMVEHMVNFATAIFSNLTRFIG